MEHSCEDEVREGGRGHQSIGSPSCMFVLLLLLLFIVLLLLLLLGLLMCANSCTSLMQWITTRTRWPPPSTPMT